MGEATRVAVLGLYRSGSSAVAGVLHHLGVDMGRPFWEPLEPAAPPFYESAALAERLRAWWHEPSLEEKVPRPERVRFLAEWVEGRERPGAAWVGAKHPLLSLCGDDLLEAWGAGTRWLWAHRPPDESIRSLAALGWWPGREAFVQSRLWDAAGRFFAGRDHLRVELARLRADPSREVERIAHYLGLGPDGEQVRAAVQSVRPRGPAPGA